MRFRAEWQLGLRYTLGHRRSRLGNFITMISALGLVLGVAMLTMVLSVMNGFEKDMREQILGIIPHIRLQAPEALQKDATDWRQESDLLASHPQVISVSEFTELEVLLRYRGQTEPALLYALNPQTDQMLGKALESELVQKLSTQKGVVLGEGLAQTLSVESGANLTLLSYQESGGRLRAANFPVLGIFHTGTEVDQRLLISSFDGLASIPGQSNVAAGLSLQVQNLFDARPIGRELQRNLPFGFRLLTWEQTHGNLYEAIQMSRYLVLLIVILILAIAAFNLVATLLISSADKQGEIAILKTLGAEPGTLARIFAFQGFLIGVLGTSGGVALGVMLALNVSEMAALFEAVAGVALLNTEVYPLDYLPSDLRWSQVAWVALTAVILSVAAALYPAWNVSRIDAARVLRYE